MIARLWLYQRERFPLALFAPLALAAGASATAYSSLLRGGPGPGAGTWLAASGAALLLWAQMRVLDEFKDAGDDARYRPYRAVPRGLVSLRELGGVFAIASVGEVALALAVDARLLWILAATWAWLALMTVEFGAAEWLRARPAAYLATHCPIGFLAASYLCAFDWLPAGAAPQGMHGVFALVQLAAMVLLEIGRKVRAPADEERGVVTYSAAWGKPRAVAAWLAALATLLAAAGASAQAIASAAVFTAAALPLAAISAAAAWRYLRDPQRRNARLIEATSGAATVSLQLALGPLPILFTN